MSRVLLSLFLSVCLLISPAYAATFQPSSTADDGMTEAGPATERTLPSEAGFGIFYLGSGGAVTAWWDGAWIFRSTGIAQGSTINTCTLTLQQNLGDTANGTPDGAIYGFAVDSPTSFTNTHTTHRISDHHTRTTASVTADITPADPWVSPSCVSPVQEVVNRAGFSGDIGITWRSTDPTGEIGHYYPWVDYTDLAGDAAVLTITWTPPASGGTSPGWIGAGGWR